MKIGKTFWSRYLNSHITVVFYLTNKHWWFRVDNGRYKGEIFKAGTTFNYFSKNTEVDTIVK